MRAFIGIPVPPGPAFETVARQIAPLPGARTVPIGSWHVTLRFLGDIDDPSEVGEALDRVVRGHRPLPAVVESLGTFSTGFPPDAKARVAWAGVRAHGLEALAQAVQQATADFGEPLDRRPFVGHVTLARFAKATDLRRLVAQHQGTLFCEGALDRVVLYESVPGPGAVRYEARHTSLLGQA